MRSQGSTDRTTIRAMPRRIRAIAAVLAGGLVVFGCGNDDRPMPQSCVEGAGPITNALVRAPGPVRLVDGTPLSTCVERARSNADLQNLGAVLTEVADALAGRAPESDRAALELGYLVGAARRGAARTSGIHEELVRRLEQAAGPSGVPAARRPAYTQGRSAGARAG
jgi:hypothetical protein